MISLFLKSVKDDSIRAEGHQGLPGLLRGRRVEDLPFAEGRGPDPASFRAGGEHWRLFMTRSSYRSPLFYKKVALFYQKMALRTQTYDWRILFEVAPPFKDDNAVIEMHRHS
jgi:hypothetical protein